MNDIMSVVKECEKQCPKFEDGRINYKNAKKAPVITVVAKHEEKILLLKRSDKVSSYKGKWQVVAGFLDEIRPLEEKVFEELKEEINVDKSNVKRTVRGEFFEFRDKKINKTWIVQPVLVELNQRPDIVLEREHTEYQWIHPEDTEKFDVVPNLRETVRRVL